MAESIIAQAFRGEARQRRVVSRQVGSMFQLRFAGNALPCVLYLLKRVVLCEAPPHLLHEGILGQGVNGTKAASDSAIAPALLI